MKFRVTDGSWASGWALQSFRALGSNDSKIKAAIRRFIAKIGTVKLPAIVGGGGGKRDWIVSGVVEK